MPNHPQRFWLAAFLVAWSADFLFWKKPLGVSFVIFVALVIAAGLWMALSEKMKPVWTAPILAGVALLAAGMNVWRSEPLTRGLNGFLAFGLLGLLVLTLRVNTWLRFGVVNYLVSSLLALAAVLTRGARLPLIPKEPEEASGQGSSLRRAARASLPVIRGVVLALPVVAVFGSLLAMADPVFGDNLTAFFDLFDLTRLPEYLFRMGYIIFLAYMFVGALLYAVLPEESIANRNLVVGAPRFLGSTEAFIVMGSVNMLFAAFVAVQFRYFFGGQANITTVGYTYSEYARRGFFELVAVAALSLAMIAALGAVTRREQPVQFQIFSVLSGLLVALVWVMLISAFMRLQLYEDAYGFTRQRMYTHLFIPWLGLLLLAAVGLQMQRRESYFLLSVLLAAVGFTFTLALANVDGAIAGLNIQRANRGLELDGSYLVGLSDDALPVLVDRFVSPATAPEVREQLGAVLSCRVNRLAGEEPRPWQGYHPGMAVARGRLVGLDLSAYPVVKGDREDSASYGDGKLLSCYAISMID